MSTYTSTFPSTGTIPSSLPQKMTLPTDARTSRKAAGTTAITRLAGLMAEIRSEDAEKFYQDHIVAIYMCIYLETAMAPFLGALGIYLYGHGMM